MSKLGVRTLDELVGRVDLLKRKDNIEGRAACVDLNNILNSDFANEKIEYNNKKPYNFELQKTLDEKVLIKQLMPSLKKKQKKTVS